ncbi:hypothetical protein PG993_004643 [Apiospora rasikravindrae]|uniref:Amidoligase enzyme n=1 Tax=Apiospora rasikravindrae TaxID=990691 RepID=A0ABR1TDC0_9PEZI
MAHLDDPIMALEDRQGDLTFGVEIEFLAPVIEVFEDDPHPVESREVLRVSKCDPNNYEWIADLSCFFLKSLQKIPDLAVEGEDGDEYVAPHDNVLIYDHWRLIGDSSVQICTKPGSPGSQFPAYHWDGKEVTSEVLSSTDPDHVRKVTEVCRAIRSHRVHLNENTSVHVHVGRGDEGFTLTTIKKIITFLWFADVMLFDLHHPSRLKNLYCRPISEYSRLTEVDYTGITGTVDPEGLKQMSRHVPEILATMDDGAYRNKYKQLNQMWGRDEITNIAKSMLIKKTAINLVQPRGSVGFRRFMPQGKTGGNTNTFEFRHMAGSLEPEHILHWAHVCIGIVNFARNSDASAFREQISKFLDPSAGYGGVEVLEDLGLAKEAKYFRSKTDSYKKEDLQTYKDGDKDTFFVPPM